MIFYNRSFIQYSLVLFLGFSLLIGRAISSTAQDNSLLWSVYREDLKDTSFLFGTIHLIPAEDFFIPGGLERVMSRCKTVFFEIDMQEELNLANQISLLPKLRMKDGLTLEDLFSESEYQEIQSFFKEKGLPLFFFNGMKPMFIQMMVQMDVESMQMGKEGGMKSYEMYLSEKARLANLPTAGLETIDYQVGIFDSIPYEVQASMLLETLRAEKNLEGQNDSEMEDLFALYKSEDLNKIQEMMNQSEDPIAKEYADLFLFQRNKNWIPLIMEAMEEASVLVAVGAAHLPGEKGVIQLLREQGYQVNPLRN
jgi:uncharacterized protein YbaP (TraB family)